MSVGSLQWRSKHISKGQVPISLWENCCFSITFFMTEKTFSWTLSVHLSYFLGPGIQFRSCVNLSTTSKLTTGFYDGYLLWLALDEIAVISNISHMYSDCLYRNQPQLFFSYALTELYNKIQMKSLQISITKWPPGQRFDKHRFQLSLPYLELLITWS